ncbi:MAG: 2,3,4,5-tetrahydropyridine-2,6-dicarboxylate N-succinyltransferase, partial [Pseudomonadota bacterium]
MSFADLAATIETAFDNRDSVSTSTTGEVRDAVDTALGALDSGEVRVAEKHGDTWKVNEWAKKAVLLSFRLNDMAPIEGGPGDNTAWWDKVPSKFEGWGDNQWRSAGFRAVPNCVVRRS